MKGKRGQGTWELVWIIIAIVILIIMSGAVVLLLSGKGGELWDVVRNVLRFGR